MIYLELFWQFFQIGLFAIGGGMAAIPFLQRLGPATGWFDQALITDMIAISESTPGPLAVNMATYVGCHVSGFLGGVMATMGVMAPSVIIVSVLARCLTRLRGSRAMDAAFYGLRPAVTGLIAAAGLGVIQTAMLHWDLYRATGVLTDLVVLPKVIFFAVIFFAIRKWKLHPTLYIAVAAVAGILLGF